MRVVQHADDEEDEAESSEEEEEGDSSDEVAVSDGGEEEEEGAAAATVPRRRATQTSLPAGPPAPSAHAAPRAKIKLSFAATKAAAIAAGGCKVCCQHRAVLTARCFGSPDPRPFAGVWFHGTHLRLRGQRIPGLSESRVFPMQEARPHHSHLSFSHRRA